MLLYRDIKGRILVKVFMDSEPTLESIASSRQVESKSLWIIFVSAGNVICFAPSLILVGYNESSALLLKTKIYHLQK